MKKLIWVSLVVAMMLALASCNASDDKSDEPSYGVYQPLIGTWEKSGQATFDSFTLSEEGVFTANKATGTWKANGNTLILSFVFTGESDQHTINFSYTLNGDILTITEGGQSETYTKSK